MFDGTLPRGFKTWVPEAIRAEDLRTAHAILSLIGSEPRQYTMGQVTNLPLLVWRPGRTSPQRRLEYIAAYLGDCLADLVLYGPIIRIPAAIWSDVDRLNGALDVLKYYLENHKTRRLRINLCGDRVLLSGFLCARATRDRDVYLDDTGRKFSYHLQGRSCTLPAFSYPDPTTTVIRRPKQEEVEKPKRCFKEQPTPAKWYLSRLGFMARFTSPEVENWMFAAMRRKARGRK